MKRSTTYQAHRAKLAKRRGYKLPPDRVAPRNPYASLNRFGLAQERRAVHVFSFTDATVPDWWHGIRHATLSEDRNGVDAWVTTDRGWVPVQVKSSMERAVAFRKQHPDMEIAIVVLRPDMTDEEVRALVIKNVGIVRDRTTMTEAA